MGTANAKRILLTECSVKHKSRSLENGMKNNAYLNLAKARTNGRELRFHKMNLMCARVQRAHCAGMGTGRVWVWLNKKSDKVNLLAAHKYVDGSMPLWTNIVSSMR